MLQKLIHRVLGVRAEQPSSVQALHVSAEARAVVQQDCLAVFHAGRGVMFKANAAGAHIWEALAKETPVRLVAEQLAERFGIPRQQAEHDVARFVDELRSAGLVAGVGSVT